MYFPDPLGSDKFVGYDDGGVSSVIDALEKKGIDKMANVRKAVEYFRSLHVYTPFNVPDTDPREIQNATVDAFTRAYEPKEHLKHLKVTSNVNR